MWLTALLAAIPFTAQAIPGKESCPRPTQFQGHAIAPAPAELQSIALATHCVWRDASTLELKLSQQVQNIASESTFEGRTHLLEEQQEWRQAAVINCSEDTRKQLGLGKPAQIGHPALFPEFYARCIRERISQRLGDLKNRPLR